MTECSNWVWIDWQLGFFSFNIFIGNFFVGIYADCVLMIKVVCEDDGDEDDDKGGV